MIYTIAIVVIALATIGGFAYFDIRNGDVVNPFAK